MDLKKLTEQYGDVIEVVTPSGDKVVLRQQTGEDDDILSSPTGSYLGENLNKFVQGIVVRGGKGIKPTYDDIESMKLCDKYFIIIASRIFSLGNIVRFEYEWPDGLVAEYEEDLEQLIWDYASDDFPVKGDVLYNKFRIPPHQGGNKGGEEFTTSSGKHFRFTYMNGEGEKYLMQLSIESLGKNTELRARQLEQKLGDNWVKVENFKNYNAKEMVEIRNKVFMADPIIQIFTEIPHPKTKEKIEFPILSSSDFLFPREI